MGYLLESEITSYTNIPGITLADTNKASELIDAYKGRSFLVKTYTNEPAKLTKKKQGYFTVYKGKLLHLPRVSITSIIAKIPSPFGGVVTESYDTSYLEFDDEEREYFTFTPQSSNIHSILPSIPPGLIYVTYTAGYSTIPEALKVATGIICDNAKQNGGFRSFKSKTNYDMAVAFSDKQDPIMSSNVIDLINSVKLL